MLLIWALEAGDAGAINHSVTGVDMSLGLMLMTRLTLSFPVLSHSRDGLWTQFISLATFQRSIQLSALSLLGQGEPLISYVLPPFKGFFPLQWPLSGTMQLIGMCNVSLTLSRSAAALSQLQ